MTADPYWSLDDARLLGTVYSLSDSIRDRLSSVGDVRMVSLDGMVKANLKGKDLPKTADAVFITNKDVIFVEFKGYEDLLKEAVGKIGPQEDRMSEDEGKRQRRIRAEIYESVRDKAVETLCIYHRFLRSDDRMSDRSIRFFLVGADPVSETASAFGSLSGRGDEKPSTPPQLSRLSIRDNAKAPVFYNEVLVYTTSAFADFLCRNRSKIIFPDQSPEETPVTEGPDQRRPSASDA